jgi:hypothetical protein
MSTDISVVHAASIIALMMEAARTSETSADIQLRTQQYIPDDSELPTRHPENLKSHNVIVNTVNNIFSVLANILALYEIQGPHKLLDDFVRSSSFSNKTVPHHIGIWVSGSTSMETYQVNGLVVHQPQTTSSACGHPGHRT